MADHLLARIVPFDGDRNLTRDYTIMVRGKSTKFLESHGWYKVAQHVGDALADIRIKDGDRKSPLIFEVKTPEEAEADRIAKAAEEEAERKRAETDDPSSVQVIGHDLSAVLPETPPTPSPQPASQRRRFAR